MAKKKAEMNLEEAPEILSDLEQKEIFCMQIDDEDEEYTLLSFDNLKRPKEEQMKIVIKPLSGKDMNQLTTMVGKRIRELVVGQGLVLTTELYREHYNELNNECEFIMRVKEIKNFTFKNKKGEIFDISSAEELYNYPSDKVAILVREILNIIQKRDLDLKN